MTVIEIKQQIVERLDTINDTDLLTKMLSIANGNGKEIDHFTDAELELLREADKEIEDGNFYTHEEANKKMREWLNK